MLVLIDGHSVAYRVWFANKRQLEQIGAEGLFAYLVLKTMVTTVKHIELYARKTMDLKFVRHFVCWDDPSSRDLRRKLWPGYKAKRQPIPYLPEYIASIKETMYRVHPRFAIYGEGMEADDILALVATNAGDVQIVIATTDSDLHQLLIRDNILVYDHKKEKMFDTGEFIKENNFGPEWLPLYKATVGDTTDEWKGIKQFGPVAFTQAMNQHRTPGEARNALVEQYGDVVTTGYDLCALPIHGANYTDILSTVLDAMSNQQLPDWQIYLDKYNIEAMDADYVDQYLI